MREVAGDCNVQLGEHERQKNTLRFIGNFAYGKHNSRGLWMRHWVRQGGLAALTHLQKTKEHNVDTFTTSKQ